MRAPYNRRLSRSATTYAQGIDHADFCRNTRRRCERRAAAVRVPGLALGLTATWVGVIGVAVLICTAVTAALALTSAGISAGWADGVYLACWISVAGKRIVRVPATASGSLRGGNPGVQCRGVLWFGQCAHRLVARSFVRFAGLGSTAARRVGGTAKPRSTTESRVELARGHGRTRRHSTIFTYNPRISARSC